VGALPQSSLHPQSDFAWATQDLFSVIFWWAVAVFVVVEALLLYIVVRFRARPGAPTPRPTHGHTLLEIGWTVAPALILVFIAIPTIQTIFRDVYRVPDGALRVEVTGRQWWWEIHYPELGIVTASELHLPVGRPVALQLGTLDVIHSFWVPRLAGKRDMTPGRTTHLAFTPDRVGVFPGQCGEFCGVSHANMLFRVVVTSDSAFRVWARREAGGAVVPAPGSLEARGRDVFTRTPCVGCHTIAGVSAGLAGPNLTHIGSRTTIASGLYANDARTLARWIVAAPTLKPGALMPPIELSPADRDAVVAYLLSLK
jgi:cytochrome c oxidase subunit 2